MADEVNNSPNRGAILNNIIQSIEEVTDGWERQFSAPLGPETLLGGDLAFNSLDLVRLITAVQQRYSEKYIPFQELFISGEGIVQDLRVSDIVDFLHKHLNMD